MATGAWLAWPAPSDAGSAIDECEHDLAVLGRLMAPETPRDEARGAPHYLLSLNEPLKRSLRDALGAMERRWSATTGSSARPISCRQQLAASRLTARSYSVTALQRFSSCPYQFLLGSIYRLEPLERPAPLEQLDPLTRGALFHEVQRDVLRALAGDALLPLTPEQPRARRASSSMRRAPDASATMRIGSHRRSIASGRTRPTSCTPICACGSTR